MIAARVYRRAQIEATKPDTEIAREDYEARALRALYTHRWLEEPDRVYVAQLKGGASAWPAVVKEFNTAYGSEEAREPRPRLKPHHITDHDEVMVWFNGIGKRAFTILWYRGALDWSYQRIGDVIGRSKEEARRKYRDAMDAVIQNAARGAHEI